MIILTAFMDSCTQHFKSAQFYDYLSSATNTWEGRHCQVTKHSTPSHTTGLGYYTLYTCVSTLCTVFNVLHFCVQTWAIMLYKFAEMYDEEKDMNLVREDDGEK